MRQLEFEVVWAKRLDADADGTPCGGERSLGRIVQRTQLFHLLLQVDRVRVPDDLKQGHGHGEDHEDVDHHHVGSGGQAVGNPNVAGDEKWNCALTLVLVAILDEE